MTTVTVQRIDINTRKWVIVGEFEMDFPEFDLTLPVAWRRAHLDVAVREHLEQWTLPTGDYFASAAGVPGSGFDTMWIAEHGDGVRRAHLARNRRGGVLNTYLEGVPCRLCRRPMRDDEDEWTYVNTLPPICRRPAKHAERDARVSGGGHVVAVDVPDNGCRTDMEITARELVAELPAWVAHAVNARAGK